VDHMLLTGGGIIPEEDVDFLVDLGVGKLFGPGTRTTEAIEYICEWFATRETL
jgi:methylmalonyl-CoA mutase C-terminal domain/subunit